MDAVPGGFHLLLVLLEAGLYTFLVNGIMKLAGRIDPELYVHEIGAGLLIEGFGLGAALTFGSITFDQELPLYPYAVVDHR